MAGYGQCGPNAGVYLLAKLDMRLIAELEASELLDVDQVEVKNGIIQPGRRPPIAYSCGRTPSTCMIWYSFSERPSRRSVNILSVASSSITPVGSVSSAFLRLLPWQPRCIRNTDRGSSEPQPTAKASGAQTV